MSELIASLTRIDDTHGAVRVEDVYDTNIEDLWSALTEPGRLARWMAQVEGDLRVGGAIRVALTSGFEGPGRIDGCDAPTRLRVTLQPETDEQAVIDAVLSSEGDRTRLVIEERGLPLDVLHLHAAGWQSHAEDLARHLAGGESRWQARWAELSPSYEAMRIA